MTEETVKASTPVTEPKCLNHMDLNCDGKVSNWENMESDTRLVFLTVAAAHVVAHGFMFTFKDYMSKTGLKFSMLQEIGMSL